MMKKNTTGKILIGLLLSTGLMATGCGKDDATAVGSGVILRSNPLSGPSAAFNWSTGTARFAQMSENLMQSLLGIPNAWAAVSSFTTFKVCVSEVVWELASGSVGTAGTSLKPGLIDFAANSNSAKTIGTLDIANGTVIKNIKFTIATVPSLCGGANYAVLFNNGSTSDISVTQDVSFAFNFASNYTVDTSKSLTVYLGDIVNGMAALGSGLNNSTIQTVNVGQAQ